MQNPIAERRHTKIGCSKHLRPLFALLALLAMAGGTSSAIGAVVTCVQKQELTDDDLDGSFVRHLREQGWERPVHPICATALLAGEIKPGDADAVETLVRENLPFLGRLAFNSTGGNVAEAMQVGRVARHYYLATEAPSTAPWTSDGQRRYWLFGGKITDASGAICASACFFAWLGGTNRTGEALGIHRPFPPMIEMQKLSPAEAERFYNDLQGEIRVYLSEMGAAPHWLSDMMKIPPDELQIIPEEQIREELEGDERAIFDLPSLAQWKFAKCGGLSTEEWNDLVSLASQAADGTLPKKMRGYHDYVERRFQKLITCGNQAVIEARWHLRNADPKTMP